jgi:hypothetical protein
MVSPDGRNPTSSGHSGVRRTRLSSGIRVPGPTCSKPFSTKKLLASAIAALSPGSQYGGGPSTTTAASTDARPTAASINALPTPLRSAARSTYRQGIAQEICWFGVGSYCGYVSRGPIAHQPTALSPTKAIRPGDWPESSNSFMAALLSFRSRTCVPRDRLGHMHQHPLTPDDVANNLLTRSQWAIVRGVTMISDAINVN